MRTSEEIYHRVRWDPRFDPARFTLGVSRREGGIKRLALSAFTPGGDIPWHRVMFVEADGEVVWDRANGVDRIDATRAGRVEQIRLLRASAWRPISESRSSAGAVGSAGAAVGGVRVLTWNTLWDRYDADRICTERRRPLLLDALRTSDADVIALQEVEAPLLASLGREEWVRAGGYSLWSNPGKSGVDEDGLVLLSRLPVLEAGRCALGPYKAALAITVAGPAGSLVVATTHLTSNHTAEAATRRAAELAELAAAFGGIDADLVVLGDFNDSTSEPADALGLLDTWTALHGAQDTTPTFDPTVNPLAAVSSLTGRAGRLDRVLLRARGGGVRAGAASLVGDVPDETGLFPSDHFGIRVDLVGEGSEAAAAVQFAPPTARTALAWIPPRELWPTINELRERYDPQAERWPPHVNVLFGFVPEYEFERAAPLLADAAAHVEPFAVRLDGVDTFGHRDDATIWLDPAAAASDPKAWAALHEAFQQRFPGCRGRDEGFTPHLTLGRATDPQQVAAHCAARLTPMTSRVGTLALLSRRGDEPMRVRAEIELGTGAVTWIPEAASEFPSAEDADAAGRVVERIRRAVGEDVTVHVVGSRRMGCALPGADVDLVAEVAGATVDIGAIRDRLTSASHVRHVVGARVPGLRMKLGGLGVDLVIVPTGDPEYAEATAISLSAVTDADAVLEHVGADHAAFATLARQVKAWAVARGLDSAPFGGLPGLAWSILAARTTDMSLAGFFAEWAAWDWRQVVTLDGSGDGGAEEEAVRILTPSAPVRSCTAQVGAGMRDLLVEELYRGWEITQEAESCDEAMRRLCEAPPLHRRHAAWAVVTIDGSSESSLDEALGRARGRMRALITLLEAANPDAVDVHAWPRPEYADAGRVRYVVGLGRRSPMTRNGLAEVAERWAKGMSGVDVRWAEGGAVGSLTEIDVFDR